MTQYPHAHTTIKPPKSPGRCFICNGKVSGDLFEEHLQSCLPSLHWPKGNEPSFLIRIMGKHNKKYWLYILASPEATLQDLDSFLRDVWLECCNHLSSFTIGLVSFSSDGADEDMCFYLKDLLQPGDESIYQYDFGSTTTLRVSLLRAVPIHSPEEPIVLLGQNSKAHHVCMYCKEEADYSFRRKKTAEILYFCSRCLENQGIDEEICSPLSNSPRAGVCDCMKGDVDGIPWHPYADKNHKNHPTKGKKPAKRYNRDDLYSDRKIPLKTLLLRMKGITYDPIDESPKILMKNPHPFPKTIPDDISQRYTHIHDLCLDFCANHPDLNMEKPVLDLLSLVSRIPFTVKLLQRGTESAWASGFIYAIGQMKGLFTRGREKGLKSYHIGDYFGVKGEVPKGRAYLIRTELRKVRKSWEEEYAGTIFDGEVADDWVELMNEWVGEGSIRMYQ